MQGKGRSQETREEATVLVQVWDGAGLGPRGEEVVGFGPVLKVGVC